MYVNRRAVCLSALPDNTDNISKHIFLYDIQMRQISNLITLSPKFKSVFSSETAVVRLMTTLRQVQPKITLNTKRLKVPHIMSQLPQILL